MFALRSTEMAERLETQVFTSAITEKRGDSLMGSYLWRTCCIVGGGPAGMVLGYLLAHAGIEVQILEKHADSLHDFRGDTVHPSTLELMHEFGCPGVSAKAAASMRYKGPRTNWRRRNRVERHDVPANTLQGLSAYAAVAFSQLPCDTRKPLSHFSFANANRSQNSH